MFRSQLVRDLLTGIFALGAIVGLCVTLMLIGEFTGFGESYYHFHVHLANGAGLAQTSPITLNGVKIGKVVEARVATPPVIGAEITVEIKSQVKIPQGATVSIDKGLVGDATLEFTIPPTLTPEQMAQTIPENGTFEGGNAGTLIDRIQSMFDKPMAKLEQTATNIDELSRTYVKLGNQLSDMLEPRTSAEVDAGKSPNIRSTLARLDSALSGADKWLNDKDLMDKAHAIMARADQSMDQLTKLVQTWQATATSVQTNADKIGNAADEATKQITTIATQATDVLHRAQDAAGSMATLIEGINQGKGTLGQLTQNPELYNSLRSASERLEKALAEVQLLVEKYKTEGLPIHF